ELLGGGRQVRYQVDRLVPDVHDPRRVGLRSVSRARLLDLDLGWSDRRSHRAQTIVSAGGCRADGGDGARVDAGGGRPPLLRAGEARGGAERAAAGGRAGPAPST